MVVVVLLLPLLLLLLIHKIATTSEVNFTIKLTTAICKGFTLLCVRLNMCVYVVCELHN